MLTLVYPAEGYRTYETRTFFLGSVPPGVELRVNQESVHVDASGGFAHVVDLCDGENRFLWEWFSPQGEKQGETSRHVFCELPVASVPEEVLALHPDIVSPKTPVSILAGDWLTVTCLATPGVQASVTLPGLMDMSVLLSELGFPGEGRSAGPADYVDNKQAVFARLEQITPRIPKRGFYQGQFRVPPTVGALQNVPILLHLQREGGERQTFTLPGTVTVWEGPRYARVSQHQAVTRTLPKEGARLTPQLEGTPLWIDRIEAGWARSLQGFWLCLDDLTFPQDAGPPPVSLRMIQIGSIDSGEAEVILPLTLPGPSLMEITPEGIQWQLWGVDSQCDFIHFPTQPSGVENITWTQRGPEHLELKLSVSRLCGYALREEPGKLVLLVRTLPQKPEDCLILLDPGHGGEETGATSLWGAPEKDLNLALGQQVGQALTAIGFQVAFTRTGDETVSLSQRSQRVESLKPHIVLSLHHNALPDSRNPWEERGSSTYYYHPFARALAQVLQGCFTKSLPIPAYGVLYDSLQMTRIHQAMAVLIEAGFLTHPVEGAQITTPVFQQQFAQALAQGLRSFVEG